MGDGRRATATGGDAAAIGGATRSVGGERGWAGVVPPAGWGAETPAHRLVGKAVSRIGNPSEGFGTIVDVKPNGKIEVMDWDTFRVKDATRLFRPRDLVVLH